MLHKTTQLILFLCKPAKASWLLLLALLISFSSINAAKVTFEFKEKQTSQKANEIASNMLRIVNGSDKELSFYLSLNLPGGWTSAKSSGVLYQMAAGDSLFIPVRLFFKGREQGNVSNLIMASLVSETNQLQFASTSWYLQVIRESQWVASVDKMEAFFVNKSDTTNFTLSVRNTGNSLEWFTVKFTPHYQLKMFDKDKKNEIGPFFNFSLAPGTDTIFQFVVEARPVRSTGYRNRNVDKGSQPGERYPLKVLVQTQHKDNTPDKVWKSTIDFKRNTNEVRFNEFSRMVLPLTLEMRIDNILEQTTSLNFNLYGTAMLEHSRVLTYRMQSFFSEQYYKRSAFKGNYHYIGYFTPKSSFELGNITGWATYAQTASGRGAKAEYRIGNNRVGVVYVQSPDLFVNPSSRTAGIRHIIDLKPVSLVNYYQQTWDDLQKVNANVFVSGADFRINHQHIFSVRVGSSTEYYFGAPTPFIKTGMGGNINYSGTVRKFSMRASGDYGSTYYSGFRGMLNTNVGVTYRHNEKYSWSVSNSQFDQHPIYFDSEGNEYKSYTNKSQHYELRLSVNKKTGSHSFRAAYRNDDQFNVHYITRGLGFDYHPVTKSDIRFVATAFGAYVKQPESDIDDYFTAQVRTSFRYKSLTTNVRYNYGPYQAFEHLRFEQYRINHQSVYVNSFLGFWLLENRVSLEPALNYSYETLLKKSRLSFRPEIFYFSKSGWEVSAYAEFLLSKQKISRISEINNPENSNQKATYNDILVGVGLKKEFGIPLPGKRYYTAKVTAFKDLNGNMKQDKNEETLENILVTIKPATIDSTADDDMRMLKDRGEDLVTDANGLVIFRNLPKGIYLLTSRSLVENEGWFPIGEQEITLDKTKDILLPFTQGVHILGSISIDRNVSVGAPTKDPEISRIRVTAVDSAGRSYSCLTDNEGKFELYVPIGDYRITINQNAIDNAYVLEQNLILLSLNGNSEAYSISFHLREKERTVNVKKFKSDGTVVEEKEK